MKIEDIIRNALKNKTGISIYKDEFFFNGYVTQMEDGFAFMNCFVYDNNQDKYTFKTKLKIALRKITQVYIGVDNDDLPALEDEAAEPDFQHFYYDKEGLYFAEENKVPYIADGS